MGPLKKCNGCGASIRWEITNNGARTPVNPDGTSHWGTCPGSQSVQKEKNHVTTTNHPTTSNIDRGPLRMTVKEFAESLELSECTVGVHLGRIYRKIGVSSRTQAAI
jgi:hypothetical protein